MRARTCLLLAACITLLAAGQSRADEIQERTNETVSGKFEQSTFLSTKSIDRQPGNDSECGNDLCVLFENSLEEMAHDFHEAWIQAREERRRELRERRRAARRAREARTPKLVSESELTPPRVVPRAVRGAIEAANAIATTPYVWGGGHGSFESEGYDCSGAVSYALHGGGFLDSPLDSTGLMSWGEPGPGEWITVYANADHAWMVIAGIAFDTVGGPGPRWHNPWVDSPEEFVVRHPSGY